ncbi:MAG: ABC transporter ATP-binding protein [Gemmataceae bacterium]|jgi:lipopolysaccharide transport system ATP-binding protein
MARLELDHVDLTFKVRSCNVITLKEFLLGKIFTNKTRPNMEVHALKNVSFCVEQGERLGIIGHNGAGKSTMLKTLAGVYQPTRGKRIIEGRVSSLFEIALGFEPEASGWENISFRSYLQGETPKTISKKRQAIADFTELGDFLKMPVRYYSAGMLVRLAFSIATSIDPEILLVDEVLAAGDLAFQEKARNRMKEMMARAHLMVMVSHDLGSIQTLCDRAIWMDHGSVRMFGKTQDVIGAYMNSVKPETAAA